MQKRATVHCKYCKTWMKTSRIKTSRIFPEACAPRLDGAELASRQTMQAVCENKKVTPRFGSGLN